jgi:hypothetical protein
VEANIKEIQQIPNVSRVVGAFTAQAGNILQMADCIDYFINKMNIVFYSHRVSYPNCLSAQVLPQELKDVAMLRLMQVASKIANYDMVKKFVILEGITQRQIDDNLNYIAAKDQSHLWPDFVKFNQALDATRNQCLTDVVPEFKPFV